MTVHDAIQTIIDNEEEELAIQLLLSSFSQRFINLQVKCAERGARLKGIKKINEQNKSVIERRKGISALCEE